MKKALASLLAAGMAASLLAGCGGSSSTAASTADTSTAASTEASSTAESDAPLEGEITFWHSFTQGARMEAVQKAADKFMEANPGVKINIETYSWGDFNTKWNAGLTTGDLPDMNLTNTRIGLMLVYLSFSVPYAVWMLVGFFKTVPIGIEEAARIDGANKLQVFIRIVLPLVSPGIVATAIYVFINAWNEYLYSMILMSSSDKTTISVAVKTLEGADILNWGALMAACAIVVVPSIIFFCFIQNKMAGGLSDGAVK